MYNKDIFREAGLDPEKPPLTNEELFAAARQIKARTNKFGFLSTFSEDGNLKMLLAQAGIPLTDETKKKAIFNTPEAAALVREYKSLFDEGVIPRESATAEHRRALELYKGGKTAIFQSGPQFLLIIRNEAPDVYAVTGVGPTMAVPGTGEYGVDTQNLAIFAKTKNPNEAVDLALWVTNAENQLAFSKLVTIFPSVKSALADPYFTDTGLTDPEGLSRVVAARQLEHATVLVPPLPRLPEINKVLNDTMQKIMLKDEPVEKALSEAEAKCTDILAK
jgi:putative chitobiose transport system substrate-binding protein